MNRAHTTRPYRYLVPALLILLVAYALRMADLMSLPLNWIEAANINRAHRVLSGDLLGGNIDFRKWLYPYVLVSVFPTGPESPWLARALSPLFGVVSIAGVIALGRTLLDKRTGLLAALIYVVLPLAFFHERQVLSDPLLATLTTLIALFGVWLAKRPTPWLGGLLGVTMAAAFFTKISALPVFVLPLMAIFFFTEQGDDRRKALRILLVTMVATAGVILAATGVILWRTEGGSPVAVLAQWLVDLAPTDGTVKYDDRPLMERLAFDLSHYSELSLAYIGPAGLVLGLLGSVWSLRWGDWRLFAYLFIPAVVFSWIPILAERPDIYLAPRYMTPNVAPLVLLIALGVVGLIEARWVGAWRRTLGIALFGLLMAQSLYFDALVITDPQQAPFTRADRHQYLIGAPSGYGYHEMAAYLVEEWQGRDGEVHVVMSNPWEQVAAYLGPRVGYFGTFRPGDAEQHALLLAGLEEGDAVFFIEANPGSPIPPGIYRADGHLVGDFETPMGTARLFEVTEIR